MWLVTEEGTKQDETCRVKDWQHENHPRLHWMRICIMM